MTDRPESPGEHYALILAGGVGVRFGSPVPKQVMTLGGEPVVLHACRRYDLHPSIGHLVVVAHPEWRDEIERMVRGVVHRCPLEVVNGGTTRAASVKAGLLAVPAEAPVVVIHDGARPLITPELITRAIDAIESCDAVLPVVPSIDPIVKVQGGRVESFVPRSQHMRGQTPQVFRLPLLRAALDAGGVEGELAETLFEILLAYAPQASIRAVMGDDRNLKITAPLDHLIAEQILLLEESRG